MGVNGVVNARRCICGGICVGVFVGWRCGYVLSIRPTSPPAERKTQCQCSESEVCSAADFHWMLRVERTPQSHHVIVLVHLLDAMNRVNQLRSEERRVG